MGIQRTLTPTALFVFLGACASHADQFSAQNPFAASSTVKIAEAQKLSLVFSNNVQGFVGPCGCAYNPKGGLDRRLEFLKTKNYLHNSSAIVVDGGNALFPNLRLDEGQEKVLKEKAQVILQAHQLMGLSVANVGHLDLAAGLDFLRNSAPKDYPFLSTNLRGPRGEKLFDTKKSSSAIRGKSCFWV